MPRKRTRPRSIEKRKNISFLTDREINIENVMSGNIFDRFDDLIEAEEEALKAKEQEELERKQEEAARIRAAVPDFKRDLYAERNKTAKTKCFLVKFREHPQYFWYSFAENRNKAEADGVRNIRELYYPLDTPSSCPVQITETRGYRAPEFDEYKVTGKIPITALMKSGVSFTCSCCNKFKFTHEDLLLKRCFIIEGEGDLNPYTLGTVVCYDCYKKYYCL